MWCYFIIENVDFVPAIFYRFVTKPVLGGRGSGFRIDLLAMRTEGRDRGEEIL